MLYQLRTYTLRTSEALNAYANVRWPRRVPSLRRFGVTTHGTWTEPDSPSHRLFALVSYPDGADPAEVVRTFLASPEQAADMEGFDLSDFVGRRRTPPRAPSRHDTRPRPGKVGIPHPPSQW